MQTARVRYRDVLGVRDVRGLLVSDGLSTAGDQIARIAVALLVLERSGSTFAASATYALSYLIWMIGGPLLSALPDRYPRRAVMVVCDLLRAALIAVLAVPGLSLWIVFALIAAVGMLSPPSDAARSALLADLLDGERYVVANALNNVVAQAAQVLGFLIGGALVVAIDVEGALLVDAATFIVSAVLLQLFVREQPFERLRASGATAFTEAAAGVRLVMGNPRLRSLLAWGLLSACSVIATEGLAVSVAREEGGGPFVAGVLTGSAPIGFLIGSWLLLKVAPARRERLFPVLVLSSCAPLLMSALIHDLRVLVVLWVLAGCGNALQLVANSSFVQAVPSHLRGRSFGFAGAAMFAVQGLVLLLGGALAEVTGARVAVAVAAGLCAICVPFLSVTHEADDLAQGRRRFGRPGPR